MELGGRGQAARVGWLLGREPPRSQQVQRRESNTASEPYLDGSHVRAPARKNMPPFLFLFG